MSDPLTVEDVWRQVGTKLRAFVGRRIANPHEADDVTADVLLRIHRHLDDLDDREKLTSWVFRIARNAVTDHYRRTARRPEDLVADPDAPPAAPAHVWLDDQDAVLAELAGCIRPLVEALPRDYRRALELTDLEGCTQADAARLEHVSVSGMKSRVQRGRRHFAALVNQCCDVTTDAGGRLVDFRVRPDGRGCDPSTG